MDQKFETNRKPIQEMDIGKKKILDESLPLPQMNKQQTLSACKLLVHYAHHRAPTNHLVKAQVKNMFNLYMEISQRD